MNHSLYLDYKELLEKRARELLVECDFQRPPYDPWVVASHCGLNVRKVALDDGVDGYLEEEDGIWRARISSSSGETRQRFTLAHELGHLILIRAAGKGAFSGLVRYRTEATWTGLHQDPVEERLCNAFATELLMPTDDIRDRLCRVCISPQTVIDATKIFNVSIHMAARKIVSLVGERWSACSLWDLKTLWPMAIWEAGMKILKRDLLRIEDLVTSCGKSRAPRTETWDSLGRQRARFKIQVHIVNEGRMALCLAAPVYERSTSCAHAPAPRKVKDGVVNVCTQLKLW